MLRRWALTVALALLAGCGGSDDTKPGPAGGAKGPQVSAHDQAAALEASVWSQEWQELGAELARAYTYDREGSRALEVSHRLLPKMGRAMQHIEEIGATLENTQLRHAVGRVVLAYRAQIRALKHIQDAVAFSDARAFTRGQDELARADDQRAQAVQKNVDVMRTLGFPDSVFDADN